VTFSPWTVDPDTLIELRLDRAREALLSDDPTRALIEAEELLEGHPQHRDALRIVGEAALRLGDAAMAVEALTRVVELAPLSAPAWHSLGVACFGMVELERALDALERATHIAPDSVDSWVTLALLRYRVGDRSGTIQAFDEAERRGSEIPPRPRELPDATWEAIRREALGTLPGRLRGYLGDVRWIWRDFPEVIELQVVCPPISPMVDVLFQGTPPQQDPWHNPPTAIHLFRGNVGYPPGEQSKVVERVVHALREEAMAWMGLSEGDTLDWH